MKQKKKNKKERNNRKRKKQNERTIKYKRIRYIRTLCEQQQQDYYKPKGLSTFWNNYYIEYESNGDKNRNLSLEEYLNKIKTYLGNIMRHL